MNSASQNSALAWWPSPPSYRRAEPDDGNRDQRCAIELIDGRVLQGNLVDFSPGSESVGLMVRPQQPPTRIDYAKIRSITVGQPIAYVLDTGVGPTNGNPVGAIGERKAFVVSFSDGTQMKGQTLGLVRNADGLYLFVVEGNSTRAAPCLIPLANIESYELRTVAGNVLIEAQIINGDTLSAAINSQSLRRRDRAGAPSPSAPSCRRSCSPVQSGTRPTPRMCASASCWSNPT